MAFKDYFKEFQPLQVNENILLRQIDVEHDIPAYTVMYNDESAFVFYEGYSKPRNDEQVRVICQNQKKEFETRRIYSWTIADAHTNEGIGRILLSDFQNNNTAANIGFFINRHYWGKGIATACVAAVIKFGFEYMHLERIFTTAHPNNIGSWRALEKNGFLREGKLRHSMMLKDGLHDCFMYAILAEDYIFANMETTIRTVLTDESQSIAIDFVTHLRSLKTKFERGGGYWADKFYWYIKYHYEFVGFILINGYGDVGDTTEPEGWIFWTDNYISDTFAEYKVDEHTKEIAYNHVDIGTCGGGIKVNVFGKEFYPVCNGTTFRFNNPNSEEIECIKKLIEIRIKDINQTQK